MNDERVDCTIVQLKKVIGELKCKESDPKYLQALTDILKKIEDEKNEKILLYEKLKTQLLGKKEN